jgi:hypothetical protein
MNRDGVKGAQSQASVVGFVRGHKADFSIVILCPMDGPGKVGSAREIGLIGRPTPDSGYDCQDVQQVFVESARRVI